MIVYTMKFVHEASLHADASELLDTVLEAPALFITLEQAKESAQEQLSELWELYGDTPNVPSLDWKETENGLEAEEGCCHFRINEVDVK